jgi:hypothetical protein
MPPNFGSVVLVPFPFTDQSGVKKRPAVVVSSNLYQADRRDLIILAITSQIRMPLSFGEALVADWRAAGLLKPSVFKPVLTTIRADAGPSGHGRALDRRPAYAGRHHRPNHRVNSPVQEPHPTPSMAAGHTSMSWFE